MGVPLAALEAARVEPPARDVPLQPYLDDTGEPRGLDIRIEVRLNRQLVSCPPSDLMHWTRAQQLAHMTVNGASLRTGDRSPPAPSPAPARTSAAPTSS